MFGEEEEQASWRSRPGQFCAISAEPSQQRSKGPVQTAIRRINLKPRPGVLSIPNHTTALPPCREAYRCAILERASARNNPRVHTPPGWPEQSHTASLHLEGLNCAAQEWDFNVGMARSRLLTCSSPESRGRGRGHCPPRGSHLSVDMGYI